MKTICDDLITKRSEVNVFRVIMFFRQKLMGQGEDVIEEQQAHVLEDIPMRTVHAVPVAVSSRRSQVFKWVTARNFILIIELLFAPEK